MEAQAGRFQLRRAHLPRRHDYEETPDLARRTKTSESYWNKLRVKGEGPPFIKLGRRVLYRPSAVDSWLSSLTRSSTSETPVDPKGHEQIEVAQSRAPKVRRLKPAAAHAGA